jgi:hypothetical protein
MPKTDSRHPITPKTTDSGHAATPGSRQWTFRPAKKAKQNDQRVATLNDRRPTSGHTKQQMVETPSRRNNGQPTPDAPEKTEEQDKHP